jgi:hypothetical protein
MKPILRELIGIVGLSLTGYAVWELAGREWCAMFAGAVLVAVALAAKVP